MSPYIACLLLIAIALAQTTLSPHLTLLGAQPNFMFLAVFSWSLLRGGKEGMLWAFGGGILLGILSGAPFGASSLSLLLISFISGKGEVTIFRTSFPLLMAASFAGSLLHDSAFLIILQLMSWTMDWGISLWRLMLSAAGLNMVFMPLVFVLLRWLHQHTREGELAW